MKRHDMFPPPCLQFSLPNWKRNKKVITDLLPDEQLRNAFGENIITDYFEEGIPAYVDQVTEIIKPVLLESPLMRTGELNIFQMWYQTAYKDMYHGIHNHGRDGWSGVIYVNLDPTIHQGTTFFNAADTYTPNVREGDMIIFPSFVWHSMTRHDSDMKRTVISFNMLPQSPKVIKTISNKSR